ncbi:MAG: hypothetical protein WC796_00785 [Candidatus Pacearchaeota archaeon]|jgi:small subunit ribosomal protein S4e
MHKTRQNISRLWPIPRKGTKYVIVPSHNHDNGIPLLVVMRDMLKVVKTKKEMKKILLGKEVLVNGNNVTEENISLVLFDTISLKAEGKYYRLIYNVNRKFSLKEIAEKECVEKIAKVMNKKVLRGNKSQINFNDGRNLISKDKISVGDSVLINMKSKKIEKIMPIKEKSKVLVIKGKHLGTSGVISKIEDERIIVKADDKEFDIKNNEIMVVE